LGLCGMDSKYTAQVDSHLAELLAMDVE
ncbi:hypothetical protein LCGC14_2933980, partial [marine sediment metagenome]